MAVKGIGVDIVSIERFESACERTPGFLHRVLTDREIEGRSTASLAARFAAKEAVAKALGAPAGLEWHDCVVVRLESGQPGVELSGSVLKASQALGIGSWHLSLSHDGGLAMAFVVAVSS